MIATRTTTEMLSLPQGWLPALVWLVWFGVLVFFIIRNRQRHILRNGPYLLWLAVLSISVLLFTSVFRLTLRQYVDGQAVQVALLAAIPWLLAGGVLGLLPSVLLAALSGLLAFYLGIGQLFTPLLFMTVSIIFSWSIRQRIQHPFFRLLHHPFIATLFCLVVALPLVFLQLMVSAPGDLLTRTVIAMERFGWESLGLGLMLLLGGIVCTIGCKWMKQQWASAETTEKMQESHLSAIRVHVATTLCCLLLAMVVYIGFAYPHAEANARKLAIDQMTETARNAADTLATVVQTGIDQTSQIAADPQALFDASRFQLLTPGYETLALIPTTNNRLEDVAAELAVPALESVEKDQLGIVVSEKKVAVHSLPYHCGDPAVRLSFMAPVLGDQGDVVSVVWARMNLADQRLFGTRIDSLKDFASIGGVAHILNEHGGVIFTTERETTGVNTPATIYHTATFFQTPGSLATSQFNYFHPVGDLGWMVMTVLPTEAVNRQALLNILPQVGVGLGVIAIALIIAWLSGIRTSRALAQMETEARKALQTDEPFKLQTGFHSREMKNLWEALQDFSADVKKQLTQQSELLSISERLVGQASLADSLQIILRSAVEHGALSARALLFDGNDPVNPSAAFQPFGEGPQTTRLSVLDSEMVELTLARGQWVLTADKISQLLRLPASASVPAIVYAMPLRWKNNALGVFWVAEDRLPANRDDQQAYYQAVAKKIAAAVIHLRVFDQSLIIRRRLEAVLKRVTDPIIVLDENEQEIFLNDAAKSLPGIGLQHALALPIQQWSQDNFPPKTAASDSDIEDAGKETTLTNGRTYAVQTLPLTIEGRGLGRIVLLRDITVFKERDARKREFVTMTSHALRSPLTLVQGYAKILKLTGNLNEQQSVYVQNIIDGMTEMNQLVTGLLELDRLESADPLHKEWILVSQLVENVVTTVEAQSRQKNVTVVIDQIDPVLRVRGDRILLQTALVNLVDNAIRFSKAGQEVDVQIRRTDGMVTFKVADQGPGIAPLDQRKIFSRFTRSDSAEKAQKPGSGLGLAIVKLIVERHGGRVWFESQLGKGSNFYLQIPHQKNSSDAGL